MNSEAKQYLKWHIQVKLKRSPETMSFQVRDWILGSKNVNLFSLKLNLAYSKNRRVVAVAIAVVWKNSKEPMDPIKFIIIRHLRKEDYQQREE